MKNLKRSLLAWMLCLVMAFSLTTVVMAANADSPSGGSDTTPSATATTEKPNATEPPELPTTAGVSIGTLNKYSMEYSRNYYDAELGGLVLVFKLSDAGKLAALTSYCRPSYRLPDELATLRKTADAGGDYARLQMNIRAMLNELALNAGGGPDYNYVSLAEAMETAEKVIDTDEFKTFVEATKPLAECQQTDARTLVLTYTDEELAKICEDLRESAYGEWLLRLQWLDEMEFSLLVPLDATID